jgi:hypothetical protein
MIGVFLHYILLDMLFFTFFFHVANYFSHHISFYGNFFGDVLLLFKMLVVNAKRSLEEPFTPRPHGLFKFKWATYV